MNNIIKQVNDYLKLIDENYEVMAYAKLDNKYIFSYMAKINDPYNYPYYEKINNNYYIPIIDNTYIEYNNDTNKIKEINISSNLDIINKLNFININK